MIHFILKFWKAYIHRPINFLITTIGIGGFLLCLLALFLVAQLSEEVLEKEAFAFDQTILLKIHTLANPTLDFVMLNVTKLGNPNFMIVLVCVSLFYFWQKRYYVETRTFLIACLGAFVLNTELKVFFSKPRPRLWVSLISERTFSFPSGHALGSLVVYGFIAYVLTRMYPKNQFLIYSLAVFLIVIIGFSRLYLGVHWPTDIIAGYGVGFLWLMSCIVVLKLQKVNQ